MKYTILGFSQEKALEYNLDATDLLILRYFVDFHNSGKMRIEIIDKKPFYWLEYTSLIEAIPIINITSNDVLRRRLKKLEKAKILDYRLIKAGGNFSYYALSENYKYLIENQHTQKSEGPTQKSEGPTQKSEGPTQKSEQIVPTQKSEQIINLLDNSIILKDIYSDVVDYLNLKTGKNYNSNTKVNKTLIKARVEENFKLDDFIKVIDIKTEEWLGTSMEKYLRPQTLFGTKFESYLNQGGSSNGNRGENKQNNSSSKNEPDFSKFS